MTCEPQASEYLKRVAVVGTSCSGKTTFARRLAQRLKAPHIELDAIHWKPNWTPSPKEEFRMETQTAVQPEAWVLDGNYGAVRDIVWARATAVIWLNYSFPLVAYRAVSRTIRRMISQQVLWSGNRESFRMSFLSKDSILLWVLTTHRRRRRDYPKLFDEPQNRHLRFIVFSSPGEAERFLTAIRGPAE